MISVRAFAAGDEDRFLALYRACLDHYATGPARPGTEETVLEILRQGTGLRADLACDEDTAVGFALWGVTFPAADGLALFLKELFVSPDSRGSGVGRALMRALADRATTMGCSRMDWGSWQPEALAFYDRLGATRVDKVIYTVPETDFATFAR